MTAITGISTYRSPSFPTRRSPELAVDRQHHQHALAAGVGQARGVAVAGNAGQPAITAVAVLRQPAAVVAVDDGNFNLRIRGGWEAGEGGEQGRAAGREDSRHGRSTGSGPGASDPAWPSGVQPAACARGPGAAGWAARRVGK